LVVYAAFMVGIYYCHQYMMPLMAPEAASDHGQSYDFMFKITCYVTGAIFMLTQFLLFWFSYKYQRSGD